MNGSGKRSSLQGYGNNYGCKSSIILAPNGRNWQLIFTNCHKRAKVVFVKETFGRWQVANILVKDMPVLSCGLYSVSFTIVIYNHNDMASTIKLNSDHKALACVVNYDCKFDTTIWSINLTLSFTIVIYL